MRTVNFQNDVLFPIAHLLGIDPTSVDFQNEHARAWVASISSNVRYAWEFWEWPEFNLTEERAFRRIWYADEAYLRSNSDGAPDEVYYIPNTTYYRVLSTAATDPPVGTLPTNTTYFTALALSDVDHYVGYDQPGKRAIGKVLSIYNTSPRLSTPAFGYGQSPSELGIDTSWISGPTVWLKYQVRPSVFSAAIYDGTANYLKGDTVVDPVAGTATSGNCYRALLANSGTALTDTATWQLQPFPYVLSEYVKFATAADFAEEQNQAQIWKSKADEMLYREVDKCLEQGQQFFYDIAGRSCNRVPLGLSGFWWSVAAPDSFPVYA
jgi:hypothetical protein